MEKSKEALALSIAHSQAADLLGEIYNNPDVMAAIQQAEHEMANDIDKAMKAWRDAGQKLIESIAGYHTIRKAPV